MAPPFIYTLKDLRKVTPQGKEILKGIWLSFYYGAKIGVLGANGACKTTRKITKGLLVALFNLGLGDPAKHLERLRGHGASPGSPR